MLRRDNVSRRTDESDSKLVVTESLSITHDDGFDKRNKSTGECIEDTKKYGTEPTYYFLKFKLQSSLSFF